MAPTIAYIALAALGTMSPVVQANNDIKMLFIAKVSATLTSLLVNDISVVSMCPVVACCLICG